MRLLRIRLDDWESLQHATQEAAHAPGAMLFVPTTRAVTEKEEFLVEVLSKKLPNRVVFRCTALHWRPATPRRALRAGTAVTLSEEERVKFDFLAAILRGEKYPIRRKYARIPVRLASFVRVEGESEVRNGEMVEISLGGGLIEFAESVPEAIQIGAELIVEVVFPGAVAPVELSGRVVYRTGALLGIQFVFRQAHGTRRIRELVRRLKSESTAL